ncbi:aminotransferase class I/II-fold pyridoxal phosphate-dependent enzyme, partial [Leucobacter soli]
MARRRFSEAQHASAPYAAALRAHAERQPLMFMVPSHAGTPSGLSEELAEFVGERALAMDIPQLIDGIDVGPESAFVEAEQLAADAWGAHRTWFLANGSSQGNRIAVLAAAGLGIGDGIVAQRSAHSSLTDGLIVTGLAPRFLAPNIDHRRGINHGVTPAMLVGELARAAADGAAVCAVYVISPSYFGAVSDIPGLAAAAHAHGVPLIVDAAWGAHFGFHDALPESPTRLGADIVVTSAHKMGGSLGQSALVHLSDGPFTERLEPLLDRAFRLTQTTSASSLLLGSLDIARRALVTRPDLLELSIGLADRLRGWVREHADFSLVGDDFGEFPDIVGADPLRVPIDVSRTGRTGYEVRSLLAEQDGILLEIATSSAIVAFFGPGKPLEVEQLEAALTRIAGTRDADRATAGAAMPPLPAP